MRKVKVNEWMGDDGDDDEEKEEGEFEGFDRDQRRFDKNQFGDEKKGRLMFELQKSYNGDKRFELDRRYVSF